MVNSRLKVILCAAAVAATISCGSSGGNRAGRGNSNTGETAAAIAITVGKSESRDVAAFIQATGSLVASETSDIAPKAAGKVSNISVNVGQFVSAGVVIAKIDDRDARLQLATAQASVKQAEAGVRMAEAKLGLLGGGKFDSSAVPEVSAANANYQQALAELKQAEANEKRYRELTQTGDVAMVTYETYRTARDTARAKANAAKEQLNSAINTAKQSNQAIASAQANVEAARTQVAEAQKAIADTVVYAPFAGHIGSRPTAVGEYVSSASIVATILRTNPIKAQLQVPESEIPSVIVGHGMSLEVDAYKDRKFAGTVSAINPGVDPASRAATVEALVENSDNALRAGMFVTGQITREGGGKGVFVPKAAVMPDPTTNSYKVFVIQDGVAHLRVVQLGTEEGDSWQILSGMEGDLNVAISNLDKLYEGANVVF
jgi:multidrug efflux pump subunit AcrA (membrane-fusion protein)